MSECFLPYDDSISAYSDLWNVIAPAGTKKGDAMIRYDTFGFFLKDIENVGEEIAFAIIMRQVYAKKKTGTGEEIYSGEKLYYYPTTDNVSPNAVGAFGVDYYYCGEALRNARAVDERVYMRFDGRRWNENV